MSDEQMKQLGWVRGPDGCWWPQWEVEELQEAHDGR